MDEAHGTAIVAGVNLKEVMVVELGALQTQAEVAHSYLCGARSCPGQPALACSRQRGIECLFRLTVDKKVMASVMKTHAFRGITYDFIPGSEVIPLPRTP